MIDVAFSSKPEDIPQIILFQARVSIMLLPSMKHLSEDSEPAIAQQLLLPGMPCGESPYKNRNYHAQPPFLPDDCTIIEAGNPL